MAEEALKFKFSAEGTEQTSAAFAKVTGEIARQEDQYKELAHETSKSVATFGALGSALGPLAPTFEALTQSIARSKGTIREMTDVLGGGAAGLAAGGAIAVIGLATEAIIKFREETEHIAKATVNYNTTLEAQVRLLNEAQKARSLSEQLASGTADPTTTFAQIRTLEARQQQIRFQQGNLSGTDQDKARAMLLESMRLERELKKVRDDYQRELLEDREFVQRDFDDEVKADRKRDLEEQKAAADAMRARQQAALAKEIGDANLRGDAAFGGADRDSWKPGFERNEGMQQNALSMQKSLAKEFVDVQKQRFTQELSLAEKHEQDLKKLDDERKKSQVQVTHAALQAGEMVASAGIHALSELAKGHKISAREIMSGIGDEMVASGTRWLFEGLAQEIINPAGGTALIGIGAAEIAAGIGFGAASADRSGAGGGGSGARTRVSEPTYYGGSAASNNPGSVIVNMPTVVSPSAADGQRVVQAVMQARRQGLVPMGYGA